ncbi:putative centrosome and spindle pole-associated protein 1-like [Capsicum annuum]|nr:putative centrosome and spindle pole-associated protein 1-like [Capsicum annuum]
MAPTIAVPSTQTKPHHRQISAAPEAEVLRRRNEELEKELKKSIEREEKMRAELNKTWERFCSPQEDASFSIGCAPFTVEQRRHRLHRRSPTAALASNTNFQRLKHCFLEIFVGVCSP